MHEAKRQEVRDNVVKLHGTILVEELEENGTWRIDFTAPKPNGGGEIRGAVWVKADGTFNRHVY